MRTDRGIALIVVLMAMLLMMALGAGLVMTTSAETKIAANFRNAQQGAYAADAALERALVDLQAASDWNEVLAGIVSSTFVDGAPGGKRTLEDGSSVDLSGAVNLANCGKATTCGSAEMDASTADRPWGANNPRWQPFAYGRLASLKPPAEQTDENRIESPYYVLVLVADDPSEDDGQPLIDGVPPNPGAGVLAIQADAYGPHGAHHRVCATIARAAPGAPLGIISWRQAF